jgi:hypothetical protein
LHDHVYSPSVYNGTIITLLRTGQTTQLVGHLLPRTWPVGLDSALTSMEVMNNFRPIKMANRLKTPRGRKLYALRKQTPEPVLGIIKSVMGYRQSLLRGLQNVRGEWNLVTMSWNIKRMFALQIC